MGKNKKYRKNAIRIKSECEKNICPYCKYECDWENDITGLCLLVYLDNNNKIPNKLHIKDIEKTLKGLTPNKIQKIKNKIYE